MSLSVRNLIAETSLGSGIGYRRELHSDILAARQSIDFLEIVTDQFVEQVDALERLDELKAHFPLVPHGIGLSLASWQPIDRGYLKAIKRISDHTGCNYYSEHLCMTRVPGIDLGHLTPICYNQDVLNVCIDHVDLIQDTLGKPLVLENVTYLFEIPGATMSSSEFLWRLTEETGCGLLCDLTNLYINATNHGFDPVEQLKAMPLNHLVQVHLAGGFWAEDVLVDGHSELVGEASWSLLEQLVTLTKVPGCIIEHDTNFPDDPSVLFLQARRAKAILDGQC